MLNVKLFDSSKRIKAASDLTIDLHFLCNSPFNELQVKLHNDNTSDYIALCYLGLCILLEIWKTWKKKGTCNTTSSANNVETTLYHR